MSARGAPLAGLLLLGPGMSQDLETTLPASSKVAPRAAVSFEVALWVDGQTPRDEAFWLRIHELGFTAVSLSRGVDPQEANVRGMRFFADQVAGKGELELRPEEWRSWFESYVAERREELLVRPACLADPSIRQRMLDKLTAQVALAGKAGAFAASLADEPSATSHFNPIDVCMSASFRTAFRDELRRRFGGDLRALDARWGTSHSDFAQIEPMSTAAIRRRELAGASLPHNLAPWNDQLAFTDDLFVGLCGAAVDAAKQIAPDLPVGLTGMQPPAAFGGYDYRRLMRGQRFFETYDIGGARELAAAMAEPGALQFATVFPPVDGEPERLLEARLCDLLAHGITGVIVWSSREILEKGEPTSYARRLASVVRAFAPVGSVFAGARVARSPVWIVESQPALRAQWMLDSWDDGDTWPRRLSSYESEHSTSLAARASWVALLRDLGLQPDFVFAEDLAASLPQRSPRLLVLGDTLALSDAAARAIEDFVAHGGHVVADHGTGVYDESLRLRQKGVLDELFGIRSRGVLRDDWLVRNARGNESCRTRGGVAIAERGLRGALAEPLEPADVQLEAAHGEGRATFLNLAVCEYAKWRLDPLQFAAARELRSRVRQVLNAAGVAPPFFVRGEGLPTCVERVVLRARDGRLLAAIRLDALGDPAVFGTLCKEEDREVELVFAEPTRVTNLLTGASLQADPSCHVTLSPSRGAFLVLERGR